MKKYYTEITDINNNKKVEYITEEQAKKYGNIIEYIKNSLVLNFNIIQEVKIKQKNYNNIKGFHWNIVYNKKLEGYKNNKNRIEIQWKKGYEDFSGYGNRTEGKKQRCYIGKSSGWIPIYLTILTSRSFGGSALLHNAIESIKPI
jgi:hypothetical protein